MPRTILAVTFIVFLALIAGGIWLWWPEYQEYAELRKEVERKEDLLEEKKAYFADLEKVSQDLLSYKEEFDKIEAAFPDDPLVVNLLKFAQDKASENGVIAKSLSVEERASAKGGSQEIRFSGTFTGSYSSLKSFLEAVYQNTRLVEVENISFSAPGEGDIFDMKLSFMTRAFASPTAAEGGEGLPFPIE